MDDITSMEKGTSESISSIQDKSFTVAFDLPFDKDNPKDWSAFRKWTVTGVLSATGLNRIMVSTIMAPALPAIARELHMSDFESVMSMSVYLLATAFGPLLLGPLSEIYGRKPVLHATNLWFLVFNLVCGFSRSKGVLIAARLLAGLGSSAIYALGAGVLGDIYTPEQRGRSLGHYLLIPLLGVAIGPIVGGFITETTTWRWMFWSTSILQGVMTAASFLSFYETHADTILQKRAEQLRQTTGNPRYETVNEKLALGRSVSWVLRRSLSRPIRLLMFHPLIQIQACLSAFYYGVVYFVLSTFSSLFTTQYHESTSTSGLHYIAICVGEIAGAEIGGPLLDMTFVKLKKRAKGIATPELRVPMMLPGAILMSVGLFMYGWAAQYQIHWIVVDIGVAVLAFGTQMGGQALQAYVIDSYPDHTGSASAATQFLRSLAAFGFPLFAPKMYAVLGSGWGNSILAFAAMAIGIPVSLLFWYYGQGLRVRAQISY